jgi:hypothetical protein
VRQAYCISPTTVGSTAVTTALLGFKAGIYNGSVHWQARQSETARKLIDERELWFVNSQGEKDKQIAL